MSKAIETVLVCGYYGWANTGDELILRRLLADLREVHPEARVTVVTGNPEAVRRQHPAEALDLANSVDMIEAAAAADLMVLGGGGLFQDYAGVDTDGMLLDRQGGLAVYAGFAVLGALIGTPVAIYGMGVGPLISDTGRRLTRAAVAGATTVTVRDQESCDLLAAIGVDPGRVLVTADPVLAIDIERPTPANRTDTPVIGVSVRPWDRIEWTGALAAALDTLTERFGARIEFIPFQLSDEHDDDRAASAAVRAEMRHADRAEVAEPNGPDDVVRLVGSADWLVAMRLHAAMLGLAAGIPTVALAYDPKVSDLLRSAGAPDRSVELTDLPDGLVATAGAAFAPEAPLPDITALRAAAEANREAIRIEPTEPGPVEAVAGGLLADRARLGRRLDKLVWEAEGLRAENRRITAAYEELTGSRAVRLAQSAWTVRTRLDRLVERVRRR